MAEGFVIIHRTYDPIQAEILGEIMRDNGLAARVLGTRNGALVGVAQNIMQLHIEVPAEQAGAATDFLEAYFESDGAQLLREQGILADDDEDDEPAVADSDEPAPLRPLFAAGSVLLMFGGAHWYVRRPATAILLACAQIYALSNVVGSAWSEVATGLVMFGAVLTLDLVGGQLAVRSRNRGVSSSFARDLLNGTAFAAIAVAVASYVGPRIPVPKTEPDLYTAPPMQYHTLERP